MSKWKLILQQKLKATFTDAPVPKAMILQPRARFPQFNELAKKSGLEWWEARKMVVKAVAVRSPQPRPSIALVMLSIIFSRSCDRRPD